MLFAVENLMIIVNVGLWCFVFTRARCDGADRHFYCFVVAEIGFFERLSLFAELIAVFSFGWVSE